MVPTGVIIQGYQMNGSVVLLAALLGFDLSPDFVHVQLTCLADQINSKNSFTFDFPKVFLHLLRFHQITVFHPHI